MFQHEIVKSTDLDEGYVSKIVSRLVERDLVRRQGDGRFALVDAKLMLAAWAAEYDFQSHKPVSYAMPPGAEADGTALARIRSAFTDAKIKFTATGETAARIWLDDTVQDGPFKFYVFQGHADKIPDMGLEEQDGGPLQIAIANDIGVLFGAGQQGSEKLECVVKVQALVDFDRPLGGDLWNRLQVFAFQGVRG